MNIKKLGIIFLSLIFGANLLYAKGAKSQSASGDCSFRETGEVRINIPAFPHPTLTELQEKFSWVTSIESDTSPTEAVTLTLGTLLCPDEERITAEEYWYRRVSLSGILGYQQLQWLVDHQNEYPGLKGSLKRILFIHGSSLVVVAGKDPEHLFRHFPELERDKKKNSWYMGWHFLGDGLSKRGRIAISRKPS